MCQPNIRGHEALHRHHHILHATRVRQSLTRDQDRKLLAALKRRAVVSPFLGSDVTRLRDTGAAVGHKVEDVATTVLPGNGHYGMITISRAVDKDTLSFAHDARVGC